MGHRTQPGLSRLRRGLSGMFFSSPVAEASAGPPTARTIVRAPATSGGSGRRMTSEEGVAQQILQMNQTVAGTNHIAHAPPRTPAPPVKRNGRSEGESVALRLPYTYMGIQGQVAAQILLPAIGATQTVASFTCPARQNGEIEFVANQFIGQGWTEGNGALIWQILIDGVPVQGYDSILGSMGTTASPGWMGKGAIQFSENQLVQLQCRNVSVLVGGQILLGLLRGHFEPIETERSNRW